MLSTEVIGVSILIGEAEVLLVIGVCVIKDSWVKSVIGVGVITGRTGEILGVITDVIGVTAAKETGLV